MFLNRELFKTSLRLGPMLMTEITDRRIQTRIPQLPTNMLSMTKLSQQPIIVSTNTNTQIQQLDNCKHLSSIACYNLL